MRTLTPAAMLLIMTLAPGAPAQEAPAKPSGGSFKVTLDGSVVDAPFSGRVIVTISTKADPRRFIGDWSDANPVFAVDAKDVAPGAAVVVNAEASSFPKKMGEVEAGEYTAQAVVIKTLDRSYPGFSEGDLYSDPVPVSFKPGDGGVIDLRVVKKFAEAPFVETERIKRISFKSAVLSAFYHRDIEVRAAVILPKNWKDVPGTRTPTVYFLGGFGVGHRFATRLEGLLPKSADEVLVVVPDTFGPAGPEVFVDAETCGPRATMFINELIPTVESQFHGATTRDIRWLAGISSGGWSGLWLASHYPESFGNCWAFCPDPVDFTDFQRIDLYAADANVYKDTSGGRRPAAHDGAAVTAYMDSLCQKQRVVGYGDRIHMFESLAGAGELFNRDSGAVNGAAVKALEKYDLQKFLRANWAGVAPKIDGTVHVYAAEFDNFYLEGACRKLEAAVKELGPAIDVHIVPGMRHEVSRTPWQVMFQILRDRAAGTSNLRSIDQR